MKRVSVCVVEAPNESTDDPEVKHKIYESCVYLILKKSDIVFTYAIMHVHVYRYRMCARTWLNEEREKNTKTKF